MAKGLFTQGVAVLFRRPVAHDAVGALLSRSHPGVRPASASGSWPRLGPSWLVPYDDAHGHAAVEVVGRPWPDGMGDPKADPGLFAAWALGFFGPLTQPGALERALQHAWGWPVAREVVPEHAAFVRILLGYAFGAGPDDPVRPEGCDPAAELAFVTELARAVAGHPDALAVFHPGGELLLDARELDRRLELDRSGDVPPHAAWCNVRLFRHESGWIVMDTVGNGQLDLPDQEAAFPAERFDPSEVDGFLQNVSVYLLRNGPVVKNGDTIDGPGELSWQAWAFERGVAPPARPVIRWMPVRRAAEVQKAPIPRSLLPRSAGAPEPGRRRKGRR